MQCSMGTQCATPIGLVSSPGGSVSMAAASFAKKRPRVCLEIVADGDELLQVANFAASCA